MLRFEVGKTYIDKRTLDRAQYSCIWISESYGLFEVAGILVNIRHSDFLNYRVKKG